MTADNTTNKARAKGEVYARLYDLCKQRQWKISLKIAYPTTVAAGRAPGREVKPGDPPSILSRLEVVTDLWVDGRRVDAFAENVVTGLDLDYAAGAILGTLHRAGISTT